MCAFSFEYGERSIDLIDFLLFWKAM